ncbi:MAG: hypothetical protein HYZ48_03325 [Chlamydiales bacterium]|nr:hypothetical protein [Chlamydiales bacterium]
MKGCKKIILSAGVLGFLCLNSCGGKGTNSTYIISDSVGNSSNEIPSQGEPIR